MQQEIQAEAKYAGAGHYLKKEVPADDVEQSVESVEEAPPVSETSRQLQKSEEIQVALSSGEKEEAPQQASGLGLWVTKTFLRISDPDGVKQVSIEA